MLEGVSHATPLRRSVSNVAWYVAVASSVRRRPGVGQEATTLLQTLHFSLSDFQHQKNLEQRKAPTTQIKSSMSTLQQKKNDHVPSLTVAQNGGSNDKDLAVRFIRPVHYPESCPSSHVCNQAIDISISTNHGCSCIEIGRKGSKRNMGSVAKSHCIDHQFRTRRATVTAMLGYCCIHRSKETLFS